ncbi:MAG: four-helix bundle copper-binding protein [Gammaproteobacteria bacterium]|nr:four-helix bundle copper-binding protein [Gammaproteobacteria bacterium]
MNNLAHDRHINKDMQACIEACNNCHQTCLHTAMMHCLAVGDKHVEPAHFRLLMNCAEICETSTHFMLSGSAFHKDICAICAKICDACAASCDEVGDMEACVVACKACADSCRKMSAAIM